MSQLTLTGEKIELPKRGQLTPTEVRIYKALKRQFRPMSYTEMTIVPTIRDISSYDRYIRKLVEKGWVRKIGDNPVRFEAIPI